MKEVFQRIWDLALPYQDKRDDSGHAEVSLSYAQKLVELECGDGDVVLPAIILHDVGWSQLPKDERMLIFGKDVKDEEKKRVQLWHERESVHVGGEILKQIGYPGDLSAEILEIVSQHDTRKGFISKNEGLTRDADKLWRFSKRGFGTGIKRRPGEADRMIERLKTDLEKPDYMYSESAKRMAEEELEGRSAEIPYMDRPLRYFLDRLASKSPEPGGGSVAALVGALAASLVSMVANLTLDKDKYLDAQPQIKALLGESEKLRAEMQDLIQKDTEAYGALSAVYRMSRDTDAEKTARTVRMQEALKTACQVPCEIGMKSLEIARLAQRAAEIGYVAAISDAGVAVLLARACGQSAALNVKINLNRIKDEDYRRNTWAQMHDILDHVANLETSVMQIVYEKMG